MPKPAPSKLLRIAIVAAEPSGDLLAAGLIQGILNKDPDVRFEGIAGPLMATAAQDKLKIWYSMEKLSVMGIFEVLKHLPELMKIRSDLLARWQQNPPDIFIGVDAPDFNLKIENRLREQGVKTVHYVCPTVWAWREKRVYKIRKAADLVLSIFPFEKAFLKPFNIEAEYVGHMLANEIPIDIDQLAARKKLGLSTTVPVLAVLPGSRLSEVKSLLPAFMQTAANCCEEIQYLTIVMPLATAATTAYCEDYIQQHFSNLDVKIYSQQSREVLAAADVILVASGTATFEGLLSKKPMVVGYRVSFMTYWFFRLTKMLKMQRFAMANILSDEILAPEYIQQQCTPENLTPAILNFFVDENKVKHIKDEYKKIHQSLVMDTNKKAASAVLGLLNE